MFRVISLICNVIETLKSKTSEKICILKNHKNKKNLET